MKITTKSPSPALMAPRAILRGDAEPPEPASRASKHQWQIKAHDGAGVGQGKLLEVSYALTCDEGPSGDFHVYRMRMTEEINGCYDLDLDLVTDELDADTDLFLGAACQLDITRGEQVRTVYGIVLSADYIGRSEDKLLVNLHVVPAFHLLGQQTHSRIFQDQSVLEILGEVLGKELGQYGRTLDKGSKARGTNPRDYCVQYRESDMGFCVRLMEEEGISYHFVHSEDKGHEVLTLTYSNDDFTDVQNVDGTATVPIIVQRPETAELESVSNLDFLQTLTTTSQWRRDYDFLTPLSLIEDQKDGADSMGYERRSYRHTDRRYVSDDVAARNQDHLEAAQVIGKAGRGTGNVTNFAAGKVFELERHVRDDLETKFLITRVVHTGECPKELLSSTGGSGNGEQPRYRNSFECIPLDVPMRPRQLTAKPRVQGPETGIVSGPSGEEIHVDEHGRIKVQFHWEEVRTYDDTSSCWIRVRQQWSGPGWGFQFIPRVGQEVVVEFLGGDPDRPLVMGTVYNGDNGHPYTLPGSKTQSGIKTHSVSGDGSNELRFEDQSGSEEVYIHAQKDLNAVVQHDHATTVHHNQTHTVDGDQTSSVGGNQAESIGGKQTTSVGKNRKLTVTGSQSVTITGAEPENGVNGSKLDITGDYAVDVSNTIEVQAPTHIKLSCGGSTLLMEPGRITLTAGGTAQLVLDANALMKSAAGTRVLLDANALTQSSGGSTLLLDANAQAQSSGGSTLLLDANALTQSSGGSQVLLDGSALMSSPASATVNAPTATLAGGGGSVEVGGAGVTCAGGKVDVCGGMVNISGGLVKIN